MKLWTKAAATVAAIAIGMGGAAAHASLIDWTLSNGTFDDGGTFSGTFTFDTVADAITDWNVDTTFVDAIGATQSVNYSPFCIFGFCTSAFDNGAGPSFSTAIFLFPGSTFNLTNIALATPGTVAHLTGDEGGLGNLFGPPVVFSHTVTDGQAVGVLATPEPATWALMIGGMGLAGAALRAKRRLAAA